MHSEADTCTEAEMRQAIAHYMGQVRYVDDSVGRIMQSLEDNGLMDNTVVLFFSDHGELLGDYGMFHKLPVFYDSLTHIPAILYAPGVTHAGDRFTGLVEEVDLAPTLLKILDLPVPPTMCGKALDKALAERDYTGRENVLCEAGGGAPTWHKPDESLKIVAPFEPTSFGPGAMLRTGKYMISVYGDDNCELFDLEKDPLECRNVWDDPAYSAVRSELTEKLFKRVLSVKVRDTGRMRWDKDAYPVDVRFEPLD